MGVANDLRGALVSLPRKLLYAEDRKRRYGPLPRLLSQIRKWRVLATHPHADISFGRGAYLGPGFSLHIPGRGSFVVGPDVEFRRGFCAEIEGEGRIVIGARSIFTYNVLIQCTQSIEIEPDCTFGQSTIVVDGQHRFRDLSQSVLDQGYDWHPITIGAGTTVTTKCTIMANLGSRVMLGANSVVTRDIPSFVVAVGVPAKPLSQLDGAGSGSTAASDGPATQAQT